MKDKKIYPPSTIGILGGGQLGKMLALEAKKMGYKVIVLDPTPNCPCAQVCDEQIAAEFSDKIRSLKLAKKADVVTYEFENIPVKTVEYLEEQGFSVFPFSKVLRLTQNRIKEKEFLRSVGILTADFQAIEKASDLEKALLKIGLPAALKTSIGGYDGKGQVILRNRKDVESILSDFSPRSLIWEKFVPFAKEISVICVRGKYGDLKTFPVSENIHHGNILSMTIVPARISSDAAKKADSIAKTVAEGLEAVGTIGVEMFLLKNETILVNEIAPRVHNSGHYTIDACYTSQFEQHIRAICGLPLGSTKLLSPAVMLNILGDDMICKKNKFSWIDKVLKIDGANLHLYGKKEIRTGRKIGHITVLAEFVSDAIQRAEDAKKFFCQKRKI
ncbi:MAG: 5-(carboxyamino)imidazole ribonucleotide synthase [Candidatus Omnitrophica bacterium]|nr:5-(carboxyamino)imidazole ribonucleotide synthase [Candidatus Omnitrophota bacterium]MBU0896213.1 5-(carboxyamino)imidazole ribonucleotide synthase [Candidatus Omnitrophota bacterium]MBU1133444.1 5-(carboxyamino)imidazole ribonucleotide synthase [Candidatus Omnitrophota bacterium]MBU1366793.1 5-(carboxyamino)imidazole ribonucleotide synthase [Candidatus Omnitrophota bacterium]MBU1524198.1 5-(carboxyamino)imidazole ribonucleotide synthase [Candidatus Omnitrophota bacterium]